MAHGSGVQYKLSGAQLFSGHWLSGQAQDPQKTLVLRIEFKSVTQHFCELRSAVKHYYNELDAQNRERINRWGQEHFHYNAITILDARNADYCVACLSTSDLRWIVSTTKRAAVQDQLKRAFGQLDDAGKRHMHDKAWEMLGSNVFEIVDEDVTRLGTVLSELELNPREWSPLLRRLVEIAQMQAKPTDAEELRAHKRQRRSEA